jgi:antirestriction protein ArdC
MIDGNTGRRMLKHFTVFNLDQCEGIADPEPAATFEHDPIEAGEQIIAGYSGPEIIHGGGRACYSPELDRVMLPERNRFETAGGYYSTAFHELAHSTGHHSRLARLEPGAAFGSEPYAKEELIAEMSAAFLAAKAGLKDETLEQSAAYIEGWMKAIRKDPKLVIQAASAAQKAANLILGEVAA